MGFSAKKEFLTEPVQGLRMRFLNETRDFQEDERVVYADGYNETNATNVIEWEQDGVTNPDLIWKHGRLRLAELRLRPEVYTLNAEAESLTLRRGEHVRCQHDVTLWGIISGRVVSRALNSDGNLISIDLDELCAMEAGNPTASVFPLPPTSTCTTLFRLFPAYLVLSRLPCLFPPLHRLRILGIWYLLVSLDVRISF